MLNEKCYEVSWVSHWIWRRNVYSVSKALRWNQREWKHLCFSSWRGSVLSLLLIGLPPPEWTKLFLMLKKACGQTGAGRLKCQLQKSWTLCKNYSSHVTTTLYGVLKSTIGRCRVLRMVQSGIFKVVMSFLKKNCLKKEFPVVQSIQPNLWIQRDILEDSTSVLHYIVVLKGNGPGLRLSHFKS